MCHAFFRCASFYQQLLEIDQQLAEIVRAEGCACGGKLHQARYPRKPRGVPRQLLGEAYDHRLSFCCSVDGCRRRCTPPSVRFLGRKGYLGVIVVLLTALEHGLTPTRRHRLIESLDLWPQTLSRLQCWWRNRFPRSACWRVLHSQFVPVIDVSCLPGELLGRLRVDPLASQSIHLLLLLQPVTSVSCSRYLPLTVDPQKM